MTQPINLDPVSGFPEFLPDEQILFNKMLDIIRDEFEAHGFSPIETPAIERKEVLTSKGGDEREIYSLSRLLEDDEQPDADTNLALHFDLTVPLARYVSQHAHDLAFPFRRYQIQKVWRGERAQAGRYREFYQCDIDVIGRDSLSILNDAEIPAVIYKIFQRMGIGQFMIGISNRKILQGYFLHLGVADDQITEVMRIVDKLEKIGSAAVIQELLEKTDVDESLAQDVVDFLGTEYDTDGLLEQLHAMTGSINETFSAGVDELARLVDAIRNFGVPDTHFTIDPGVVRGLDYYTGTIYETTLTEHPEIGSICSGGRYDNLASHFTDDPLPGVGISIGLSRLIPQLLEAGVLEADSATVAPVLVTSLNSSHMNDYLRIATLLRNANIKTEVYLENDRLGKQFKYADKKGFKITIIAGGDEFEKQSVTVRNMQSGEEQMVPETEFISVVKSQLA